MKKDVLISKCKSRFAKTPNIKLDQIVAFLEETIPNEKISEDYRKISTYSPLESKQKKALDQGLPKGVRVRKENESQRSDAANGL